MKKVITSRYFLLALLFVSLIAAFSFMAYAQAHNVCTEAKACCRKSPSNNSGEMLWDVLSRQIVSTVHFQ